MNLLKNEIWKEIRLDSKKQRTHYGVSNKGRICSFKTTIDEHKVLKGTVVNGYPALKLKISETDYQFYIHKLVAQYFLKKGGKSRTFVLHLDFHKLNNKVSNLCWANQEEMAIHQQKSPLVKSYRTRTKIKGHKLKATQVAQIKSILKQKNRRLLIRDIADKFGISQMQLYRIKSGENWGHVKAG